MLANTENYVPDALKITGMNTYTNDSTGSRVAWARKQKTVQDADGRRRPMNGHELADAVGVRNVYISQIENNHRIPSRDVLLKIAEVLGVTVGFLLMETDVPQPAGAEPEVPVYFSEEADAGAKLIDDVKDPAKRREMLAVLRVMAESALNARANGEPNEASHLISPFSQRLIQSALLPQSGEVMRS